MKFLEQFPYTEVFVHWVVFGFLAILSIKLAYNSFKVAYGVYVDKNWHRGKPVWESSSVPKTLCIVPCILLGLILIVASCALVEEAVKFKPRVNIQVPIVKVITK
jgi:hypothetical protein